MPARIIVFFLFISCFGFSQNKQLLYGLQEVPQSLLLNPGGITAYDRHIGIPFFSQIHINGGSSGVTAYDIFRDSGPGINAQISRAVHNLNNTDFFTATQQLELIHIGWRNRSDYYFSAGIYQELDVIVYFPKDLAILAWEGNRDYLDYEFDLGEINARGDVLSVFHFGANKKITDRLTVGARAKLYSSMLNFRSAGNKGTFVTRFSDGSQNIYDHLLQQADVTLQTSGVASLTGNENRNGAGNVVNKMIGRAFFGGNFGVGIDVGATYEVSRNWTVSASVLDFGAVFNTKDIENYRAHGSYNLTGINLIFPSLQDGEATFPYYDNLGDEIKREVPIDTLYNSYTTMRPLKMNAAVMYHFGRPFSKNECDCLNMGKGDFGSRAVGIQLYGIMRPKRPQYAVTLFYYQRFAGFISGKITYTIDEFSADNVGLAAVGDFGKFNVYLAADNLLRYGNLAKANHVSLQLGFNIKYQ